MSLVSEFAFARQHARTHKSWVVLVTPTRFYAQAAKDFAATVELEDHFSGRTVTLENSSKVSLVSSTDEVFLEEDFTAIFLGWTGKNQQLEDLTRWREAAAQVIQLS